LWKKARGSRPFYLQLKKTNCRGPQATKTTLAMRKTLATLSCALLAAIGLRAQNTALQFDGVDDFAFVTVNNPPATISAESFTFEAIFKAMPNGHDMVLLAAPQTNGDLLFGLDINGAPFTSYRGNTYMGETPYLADGECHHLAITYGHRDVKFYIDGQYYYTTSLLAPVDFTNQTNMYLGMNYPDQNTAFQGVLDEVRLWPEARTDGDIATWAQFTPNITQWPRYLLLTFWEGAGTVSFDPLTNPFNFAYWVPSEGADMQWAVSCIDENFILAERLGSGTEPACSPPSNALNMICNGGFEQFHSILYTPPSWALGYQAFEPDLAGVSDVVGWRSSIGSPDMYVRNGIGGIPSPMFNLGTALNTYDVLNSNTAHARCGAVGDGIGSYTYSESLENKLISPMIPGTSYRFSGWFHTHAQSALITVDNELFLVAKSTQSSVTAPINVTQVLQSSNSIATNLGWQYVSFTFVFSPNNTGVVYDLLEINPKINLSQVTTLTLNATFMDDLVLEPVCQNATFPQSISLTPKVAILAAGSYPDYTGGTFNLAVLDTFELQNHHHANRFVETDAQGNTYVAAYVNFQNGGAPWVQQFNPTITYSGNPAQNRYLDGWAGVLLSKYNTCGELEWQHTIHNRANTTLAGLAVSPSGDVYVLGDAESLHATHVLTTTDNNSPSITGIGKRVYVAKFTTGGICSWIRTSGTSTTRYSVDIELTNNGILVIAGNNSATDFLEVGQSNLTTIFTSYGKIPAKSTYHNGFLYLANVSYTGSGMGLSISRFTTSNLAAAPLNSPFILDDPSRPSYGYPYQTVSDLLCDANGIVFLLGNFSNGLNFTNGLPGLGTNSVYQDYQSAGIGVTGFIAKYSSGLGYIKSDYLRPETQPAQMVQVLDSYTWSCNPPPINSCDVITTATSPNCPNGLTYFCIQLKWASQGAYASQGLLANNSYQDLSIDANNNVLISGIVGSANWATSQIVNTNYQPFVCKYDNALNRYWFNETQGNVGIEVLGGHSTGIAYEPVNGQHRVVGNFIGDIKLFDFTQLSTPTYNEHIFVTNVVDFGSNGVYKQEQGSESTIADEHFKVYPNPASDYVTIESSELVGFAFTLYSSYGQAIVSGNSGGETMHVNTTRLAAGIYMLHIQGIKSEVSRIVISR
jgi:hypothetical protein